MMLRAFPLPLALNHCTSLRAVVFFVASSILVSTASAQGFLGHVDKSRLLQTPRAGGVAGTTRVLAEDNVSMHSMEEKIPDEKPGSVDFLYTFGAAGSASPGLSDRTRPGGCFGGWRAWTSQSRGPFNFVDFASWITGTVGLRHPRMAAINFNVNDIEQSERLECSPALTRLPSSGIPSNELHATELYIEAAKAVKDPFWANLSPIAGRKSNSFDIPRVAQYVRQYGWCLVGTSSHPGNLIFGGAQVSHLFQNPETLDCALTFMHTNSPQDWAANLRFSAAHFCGFVDPDERCTGFSECKVRKEGGSFVHRGFRDILMKLIRDPSWQENIRPQLHACKKLAVTGHSLGGALASLFAACVNRAPQEGTYGFEDYRLMGFNTSGPKALTCKL